MRKVILSMMISLDGSIARPDGNLDWFLTDEEFEAEMLDLLRSVDAMLFGRVSYQLLADYWPSAGTPSSSAEAPGGFTSKDRQIAFAGLMSSIPKIVYSRTLTRADWTPATVVSENVAEGIARMKQEPGKDLVLFAGAGIASTFINLDLIDEYRLMVHPVVLTRGISLFKDVTAERAEAVESQDLPVGRGAASARTRPQHLARRPLRTAVRHERRHAVEDALGHSPRTAPGAKRRPPAGEATGSRQDAAQSESVAPDPDKRAPRRDSPYRRGPVCWL